MKFGLNEMWIGAGVMTGATLAVFGVETIHGVICRGDALSQASNWWKFSTDLGWRFGLGLGASAQAQAIFVIGSQNFIDVSNATFGGFELNIAFEERMALTGEASTALKVMSKMNTLADIKNLTGKGIYSLQQLLNNFTNIIDLSNKKLPQAFNFDIPAAGGGLELSAVYCLNYKVRLWGL